MSPWIKVNTYNATKGNQACCHAGCDEIIRDESYWGFLVIEAACGGLLRDSTGGFYSWLYAGVFMGGFGSDLSRKKSNQPKTIGSVREYVFLP